MYTLREKKELNIIIFDGELSSLCPTMSGGARVMAGRQPAWCHQARADGRSGTGADERARGM